MTLNTWLHYAQELLSKTGIATARLDALVLVEDVLNTDRALLLAHLEMEIHPEQLKKLHEQIARRSKHVPLAYIRGKTEFYGRDFIVNSQVLEPRPESETMIDLLKKTVQEATHDLRIADIGSGSGCLGITAALEIRPSHVDFIDIDTATLDVARRNAATHGITDASTFRHGNLLSGNAGPYDIILANLPYVPDSFHINQAATHEPIIAIFGGTDGLDLYRKLFAQLRAQPWQPKYVFTEALPPQHSELVAIAAEHGLNHVASDDFIQVFSPAR